MAEAGAYDYDTTVGATLLLEATLGDDTPVPTWDLTGATVSLRLARLADGLVVVDAAPVDVVDPAARTVSYRGDAAATAQPGLYGAQFRVVWPDGTVDFFPQPDPLLVSVREAV